MLLLLKVDTALGDFRDRVARLSRLADSASWLERYWTGAGECMYVGLLSIAPYRVVVAVVGTEHVNNATDSEEAETLLVAMAHGVTDGVTDNHYHLMSS